MTEKLKDDPCDSSRTRNFSKIRDNYKESLIGFFDKQKLHLVQGILSTFLNPLTDPTLIRNRQKIISEFINAPDLLEFVREELSPVETLKESWQKFLQEITPSDLINISRSITTYKKLKLKLNPFLKNF